MIKKNKLFIFCSFIAAVAVSFFIFEQRTASNEVAPNLANSLQKDVSNTEISKTVPQKVAAVHFLGTILVVKKGKIVYNEGFGYANQAKKIKNSANVVFPIASLSKIVTAAIIMQLISEKKLAFDSKLSQFYPDLKNAEHITIRELLDHQSGVYLPEIAPKKVLKTQKEQLAYALEKMTISNDKTYAYTNGNYTLLAGIISQLTKMDYEQAVQKRIITKLRLTHTFFWDKIPTEAIVPQEYSFTNNQDYATKDTIFSTELISSLLGAGNLYMSTEDVYLFQKSLVNGQILTQKEYNLLKGTADKETIYSGGMWHEANNIKTLYGNVSEDGNSGGYDHSLYGTEDNAYLVISLSNQRPTTSTGDLTEDIYMSLFEGK